jgi:hypothetical protein
MRRHSIVGVCLLIPALLLLGGVSGCGKKTTDASPVASATTTTTTGSASPSTSPSGTPKKGKRDPVEGDLVGVLKGKVVYDGTAPKPEAPAPKLLETKDCVEGAKDFEKHGQKWIIGADGGVANVVVFLKPPDGKYFKYDPEKLKPKDTFIDQPHCAFIPHVQVVFPTYYDGKSKQKTGQKFVVKNSAMFSHNSNYEQKGGLLDPRNVTLLSGKETEPIDFVASYTNEGKISCQLHPWMYAYVWAFDHPYAAVTDMNGNFTIENIPLGGEFEVIARHEIAGDKSMKITFSKEASKHDQEIKIKAK